MRRGNHREQKSKWIFGTTAFVFLWALLFAAGYVLSELIFRFTGRPAAIWTHMITGLVGMCIFALGARIYAGVHRRGAHGKGRWDKFRNDFLDNTIEAMDRIARGDFSVLIPVDKQNPFYELTESVNKMARELGSMENLRQDFITNISHEIQSPLTSIGGFATLLRNNALTEQQRAHYIDVIETEAGRLSKLSDNLLRLSTLESSEQPLAVTSFSLEKTAYSGARVCLPSCGSI